ncbi:hypothetical protein [Paramagnetospirillum marisnigri]|uniref:hypothetical protein n=1 Tax=Paramagnetospirillum marisnigri TaxID=1285242 RepID=UPI000B255FAD|nr:hypothetical protein [Paramagnetospirillum marisnigri]
MVVSSLAYNSARPDLVVMAVTSQIRAIPDYRETAVTDWARAGLLKPSVIKPVFATLEQQLVLRILGRLGNADTLSLRASISEILG